MAELEAIVYVRGVSKFNQFVAKIIALVNFDAALNYLIPKAQYRIGKSGKWMNLSQ